MVLRLQVHDSRRRCYQQGAPRPQKCSAFITAVVGARTPLADDEEPVFNFKDDFAGGFMWMTSTAGRTFPLNSCGMMLADSGETEHFLGDVLIPGLKDRMKAYALRDVRKIIVAASNRELHGTATGILYGTIVDQTGRTHRARFPSLIVSGLGRHVFSSSVAMKKGGRHHLLAR